MSIFTTLRYRFLPHKEHIIFFVLHHNRIVCPLCWVVDPLCTHLPHRVTYILATSSGHITVGSRGYKVSHVLDIWLFKMQNDFLSLPVSFVQCFFVSLLIRPLHLCCLHAVSWIKIIEGYELQIQQMCHPFCINLLKHISIFFRYVWVYFHSWNINFWWLFLPTAPNFMANIFVFDLKK